jgi:hypothetical protein
LATALVVGYDPLALMLIYTLVFGLIFKSNPLPGNPSGLDVPSHLAPCVDSFPGTFFSSAW